jgi:hypothetical protein
MVAGVFRKSTRMIFSLVMRSVRSESSSESDVRTHRLILILCLHLLTHLFDLDYTSYSQGGRCSLLSPIESYSIPIINNTWFGINVKHTNNREPVITMQQLYLV